MTRHIFAAEINLNDTPAYIRKKFCIDGEAVKVYLNKLASEVDEIFILATHNNFSLYVVNSVIDPVVNFFSKYPATKGYVQYYYNTEESVTHLFATSSGLLSQVKGEHQILTQLKLAYHLALECNTIGNVLDTFLREAIGIGKKVRTETGIDQYCVSVAEAGISLLYEKLDDIYNKRILIIGTEKVSSVALEHLHREGVSNIIVTGCDRNQSEQLAERYQVNAIDIKDIRKHLREADIIINGTNHEVYVDDKSLTELRLQDLLRATPQRNQIILDFGVPGNFDERLKEHDAIELFNLYALKRLIQTPVDSSDGLDEAWQMVMRESKDFLEVLSKLELSPILASYWTKSIESKKERFHWLLPENENPTEYDVELMRKFAQQMIRKVSDPTRHMLNMENNFWTNNPNDASGEYCTFQHFKLPLFPN